MHDLKGLSLCEAARVAEGLVAAGTFHVPDGSEYPMVVRFTQEGGWAWGYRDDNQPSSMYHSLLALDGGGTLFARADTSGVTGALVRLNNWGILVPADGDAEALAAVAAPLRKWEDGYVAMEAARDGAPPRVLRLDAGGRIVGALVVDGVGSIQLADDDGGTAMLYGALCGADAPGQLFLLPLREEMFVPEASAAWGGSARSLPGSILKGSLRGVMPYAHVWEIQEPQVLGRWRPFLSQT